MPRAFFKLAETMTPDDMVNAYSGACNLTAEYLNDYGSRAAAEFIAEWIEENVNVNNIGAFDLVDLVENPDYLLTYTAGEFVDAFSRALSMNSAPAKESDFVFNHCKKHFDSWGNFYLFGRQFSNACVEYWLIRADSETSAYELLTEKFECDFSVDEADVDAAAIESGEQEINENGTPIKTDNLMLIGRIISDKGGR